MDIGCDAIDEARQGASSRVWRLGDVDGRVLKVFDANERGLLQATREFDVLVAASPAPGEWAVAPGAFCLGCLWECSRPIGYVLVEEDVGVTTLFGLRRDGLLTGDAGAPFSVGQTVALALDLARCVERLTASGVAHRDLSPANVVLAPWSAGETGYISGMMRIVDFGSAIVMGAPRMDASGSSDVASAKAATIPYGAPQMFGTHSGEGQDWSQADVWSLGALIVMMAADEWWPPGIRDLRGARVLGVSDARRVVAAKREHLDLGEVLALMGRRMDATTSRLAGLASACTQFHSSDRPRIDEVVRELEKLAEALPGR